MKSAVRARVPATGNDYRRQLKSYVQQGGELELRRAYELGRSALAEGTSIPEIVAAHHATLLHLMRELTDVQEYEELWRAGGEFLSESLSPYEMAYRGYRDGIFALRRLNEMLEEGTRRIAQSIHDESGQLLVAVHLALANFAEELTEVQRQKVGAIQGLLDQVEHQIRKFSHELRPAILDDLGWLPALQFLAGAVSKRVNLPINIRSRVKARLPAQIEVALYRIVQEALSNVVKHSKAKSVEISVRVEGQTLCCIVRDDGAGFDLRSTQVRNDGGGLGLLGIRERLNALGGVLKIASKRKHGTRLDIRIPMGGTYASSRGSG